MELMKQKQYSPMSVASMAVSLFGVEHGFLDDVNMDKIGSFESALQDYVNSSHGELMKNINDTGNYDDEVEALLRAALEDFKSNQSW